MTTAWKRLGAEVTRTHASGRTTVVCVLVEQPQPVKTERLDLVIFSARGEPATRTLGHYQGRASELFTGLSATLSPEARGRLAQWWAPDPETGDARFDAEVLISTRQPQTTLSFLSRADVRAELLTLLERGARVTFEQRTVTADFEGQVTDDPPALLRLVEAYATFARS